MPPVNETVSEKKAVIFDLLHTLTAVESSWGKGLPTTHEMLGFTAEAWDEQIRLHSHARLTGEQKDPFRIVADMARAVDPAISVETIRAAVANRG